jgi:hypothetical protein
VLLHPRDKLVRVISLLKRMLGKDRLPAPVVTEGIAQAQRLRELTRLMNKLVDPLQIVRTLRAGQALEKRPLPQLRTIFLRRFD